VFLNVMADDPAELVVTPEQLAAHRALVTQADRLFGARHFVHCDFLFLLSDSLGRIGLEHQQSSENGMCSPYFTKWAKTSARRSLLPREYTHSWNGRCRRVADLWTPNTNTPTRGSLPWPCEGQTEFWCNVLATHSGRVPVADMREPLAGLAASLDGKSGRAWRNLQDTRNQNVMADREASVDWRDWQRERGDCDVERVLVWPEVDMLIRETLSGTRSLGALCARLLRRGAGPHRALDLRFR
jgi:predicted metalloprotease with PDZ domain